MRIFALLMALALPVWVSAEVESQPTFTEGVHYTILSGQPKPSDSERIEVTEMFWYGCGHCYTFEPLLEEWKKDLASDVNFVRSPAMWQQRRDPADAMWTHAKLYYTATAMGKLDELHPAFFAAMHRQNKPLLSTDEIAEVVSARGVDGDLFVKTMDSFAVNAQVQQADARQRKYRVTGTPEIVVGGYYHISANNAGGQREMLQVTDYLINEIREGR